MNASLGQSLRKRSGLNARGSSQYLAASTVSYGRKDDGWRTILVQRCSIYVDSGALR